MRAPDPDGAGDGNYTPPPALGHLNVGSYAGDPYGANDGDVYYNISIQALRVYDYSTTKWITIPSVIYDNGAPSTTPVIKGMLYVNQTNNDLYISNPVTATSGTYQWVQYGLQGLQGTTGAGTREETART